jgi:hypothetical protein
MYPNGAASDSAATTMTRFANPVFADDKWKCDEAEVAESFATYGAMRVYVKKKRARGSSAIGLGELREELGRVSMGWINNP